MPIFTSPDQIKDHKDYVVLLKKALLTVKPDSQKKFLYIKQFPFGTKKLPLVLVDFDPKCVAALAKAGHKPTAEGAVSLTPKDELNFEPAKGEIKRAGVQKYFSTMGGGIKPLYVPAGETADEDLTGTGKTNYGDKPTEFGKMSGGAKSGDSDQSLQILARIEELKGKAFPSALEKLKTSALDKAKSLAEAGKFGDATVLLDQLATKADSSISGGSFPINPGGLKWHLWFREKPIWPEALTKASWDKNKSTMAKMTLSTGIGEQLKVCEGAFQAAVAKMPAFSGANQDQCKAFITDATVKTLHESLKSLRDIAAKAAVDAKKSPLIPKGTTELCNNISSAADGLMVGCNPNTLSGCLGEAIKGGGGGGTSAQPWPIDMLKAEPDLRRRIQLCEKMLEQKTGTPSERDQVEDILAFAKKDWGVSQAKEAYAAQMKGVEHKGDAKTPAYNPDNKFDMQNLAQRNMIFQDKKVQDLMKSTGLTEGEVLAIRAYTASNYTYINPAIANQKDRTDKGGKDWMNTNRPEATNDPQKPGFGLSASELKAAQEAFDKGAANEAGSKKGLYEEGALHAGMMTEAFKKLPKKSGTLFRGARMSPEDFVKTYAKGKEVTYEAFASQSTSREVARGFANGGGDKTPPDTATTSVFIEAQITDARDLMALSVYGDGEKEWLLPPGTKLRVEDVQDDKQRDVGKPAARQWKKVIMKQV